MCEVEKGHRVKENEKRDLSERYTIQSCEKLSTPISALVVINSQVLLIKSDSVSTA